jgi:Uncharacterized iron-regulated protein
MRFRTRSAAIHAFFSAALPLKVFPPLFNRYAGGDGFGTHVDNAIRQLRGTDFRIRSDLSATLFLAEPEPTTAANSASKTPTACIARSCRPATWCSTRFEPASREPGDAWRAGRSFFWIQSMVRDDGERDMLFQLDNDVQRLAAEKGSNDATVVSLTGIYHNLLRRWADA